MKTRIVSLCLFGLLMGCATVRTQNVQGVLRPLEKIKAHAVDLNNAEITEVLRLVNGQLYRANPPFNYRFAVQADVVPMRVNISGKDVPLSTIISAFWPSDKYDFEIRDTWIILVPKKPDK